MWATEPHVDFFVSFIDLAMHQQQLPQVKTAVRRLFKTMHREGVSLSRWQLITWQRSSWRKPFGWQRPELLYTSRLDGFCGARPARRRLLHGRRFVASCAITSCPGLLTYLKLALAL